MCKRGGTYQKDEVVMRSLMLKTALRCHQTHFTKCHANPVRILGIFINKFGFLFCFVFTYSFITKSKSTTPWFLCPVTCPQRPQLALRIHSTSFHPWLAPSQDAIFLPADFSPSPQHSSSAGGASLGKGCPYCCDSTRTPFLFYRGRNYLGGWGTLGAIVIGLSHLGCDLSHLIGILSRSFQWDVTTGWKLGNYGFTSCSLLILVFFFSVKMKMNAGPSQASVKMDVVLTSLGATDVSAMKASSQVPQALNALVSGSMNIFLGQQSMFMMSSENSSAHVFLSIGPHKHSTLHASPHRYASVKMIYF